MYPTSCVTTLGDASSMQHAVSDCEYPAFKEPSRVGFGEIDFLDSSACWFGKSPTLEITLNPRNIARRAAGFEF